MITLPNEYSFEYVASSGTVTYDGEALLWDPDQRVALTPFVRVTPSLTLEPNGDQSDLAPADRVVRESDRVVNAKELINPGIGWWNENVGPYVDITTAPLIVSVYGDTLGELLEMGHMLRDRKIVAVEFNAFCPNADRPTFVDPIMLAAGTKALMDSSGHPIIVKLSPVHALERSVSTMDGIPAALSLNAVPWDTASPGQRSPLEAFGGGAVSGKAIQRWTWRAVEYIASAAGAPVIGPSIWEYEDIAKVRELGAKAVSFGSVFLHKPWAPTRWVERDMRERGKRA